MNLSLPIIIDSFLVLFLFVTIICCALLYSRLLKIRKSEQQIKLMIKDFNSATERAQAGLLGIKSSGMELMQSMQKTIDDAAKLKNELSAINSKNKKHIENQSRKVEEVDENTFDISNDFIPNKNKAEKEITDTERELIIALQRSR